MRERLLRDGFAVLAVSFVFLRLLSVQPWIESVDAYAYWTTRDGVSYGVTGIEGSYLYSPAFALLLAPVTWLPWPLFCALWTVVNCVALRLVAGRLALPALLFIPIPFEIVSGNVHLLYALAIVYGGRMPLLWVIPLITKVAPGIGLVWFLVRREWRPLLVAGATTAAICAFSFLITPAAWADWIALLLESDGLPRETPGWFVPIPLLPRLAVALPLIVWGAATDRRWTVPVAVVLALPVIWLNGLAVLAALIPTMWPDRVRADGRLPTGRRLGIASVTSR